MFYAHGCKRLLIFACLAFMLLIPASARAQKLLQWKFEKGQQFRMEVKQSINMTGLNGTKIYNSKTQLTVLIQQSVEDVDGEGVATISHQFERLKLIHPGGARVSYSYDSTGKSPNKGIGAELTPLFDMVMKARFTTKIAPNGKIIDVSVPDEIEQTAKGVLHVIGLDQVFSKNGLTQLIILNCATFPAQPVEKGAQWAQQLEAPTSEGGTKTITDTYTYEREQKVSGKTLDKLSVWTKVETVTGEDSGRPVKNIIKPAATSTMYFDTESGQMVKGTASQRFQMEVIKNGQRFPKDIVTRSDFTVTLESP